MTAILSTYVFIMILAAILCMAIAVFVWPHRRNNSETIPLFLVLSGITEWIVATLWGTLDQNLLHKMLWAKIEYIGVVSVPLAVLVYVLYHSGFNQHLTVKRLAWLALIPVVTLVFAWTNGNHGLIWANYIPYQENGWVFSNKTYGPGFWVYWAYSYLVLLAATVLIFRSTLASAKLFRWQSILVVIGILAPWVGNLLYVLHIDPLKNLDLTPLAFSITGIMLATGMFRWQLFTIKPIAQAAVIAGMADGLIILDNQGLILEVNPAAQVFLDLDGQEMVGKPLDDVITQRLPPDEQSRLMQGKRIEIKLNSGIENREYELSDSPFYEKQGSLGGSIIFLHDVTDRKRLEEKLWETERKNSKDTIQKRNQMLLAHHKVTLEMGAELQLPALLKSIMTHAQSLLDADRGGGIYLYDPSENVIRLAHGSGINEGRDGIIIPIDKGVAGRVFRTLQPLIIDDYTHWEERINVLVPDPSSTVMGVPLLLNGQAIGALLLVANSQMRQFNEQDVQQAEMFAAQTAIAIRNAQLYQQAQQEIFERQQAEKALRVSEDKFRYVFDNSVVGKSFTSPSGKIQVNNAFCELLGYSPEEMQSKSWQDISHPDDIALTQKEINALLAGEKEAARFTKRYLRKDSSVVWADVSTSLRRDQEGKPLYFMTTVVDITERKRVEEQLTEQIKELNRWHTATLGRERRILDLKHEVNQLLEQTGLPRRYPSADEEN